MEQKIGYGEATHGIWVSACRSPYRVVTGGGGWTLSFWPLFLWTKRDGSSGWIKLDFDKEVPPSSRREDEREGDRWLQAKYAAFASRSYLELQDVDVLASLITFVMQLLVQGPEVEIFLQDFFARGTAVCALCTSQWRNEGIQRSKGLTGKPDQTKQEQQKNKKYATQPKTPQPQEAFAPSETSETAFTQNRWNMSYEAN